MTVHGDGAWRVHSFGAKTSRVRVVSAESAGPRAENDSGKVVLTGPRPAPFTVAC